MNVKIKAVIALFEVEEIVGDVFIRAWTNKKKIYFITNGSIIKNDYVFTRNIYSYKTIVTLKLYKGREKTLYNKDEDLYILL